MLSAIKKFFATFENLYNIKRIGGVSDEKKLRKVKSQWCVLAVCGLSAVMMMATQTLVLAVTSGVNTNNLLEVDSSETEDADSIERFSVFDEDMNSAADDVLTEEQATESVEVPEEAASDISSEVPAEKNPASNGDSSRKWRDSGRQR